MITSTGRQNRCLARWAVRLALAGGFLLVSFGLAAKTSLGWHGHPPAAAARLTSARLTSARRAAARQRVAERTATRSRRSTAVNTVPQLPLQITALATTDVVAIWRPRYTAYRPLPAEPGDVTLMAGGGELWLASETEVGPLRDGVWETPQRPPEVTKIFALALTEEGAWAFGLDGGSWRQRGTDWAALPPPVIADFYDAAARSPNDVTAVGFDYVTEAGVIVSWDGKSLDPLATPDLHHTLLYAIAIAPDGEAWAGGCDYSDRPVLLRDHGSHAWTLAAELDLVGCIYDLAFSRDGLGIAAAGSDLLMMQDGLWRPALTLPPEGHQWVRVAGTPAGPASGGHGGQLRPPIARPGQDGTGQATTGAGNSGTAWAIAGKPTWRGYSGGTTPWYFDGYAWRPAAVDLRGWPGKTDAGGQTGLPAAYLDLATDGVTAYSVCRDPNTADAESQAAVLVLEGGVVRLQHPWLDTSMVIAGARGPTVWVGGRGPWPLIRHEGTWFAEAVERRTDDAHFAIEVIDMATTSAGWALGSEAESDPVSGELQAWRWDGTRWGGVPLPTGVQMSTRLRASPDGGAWLASRSGQLWAHDGSEWRVVKSAPPVASEARSTAGGAPFDLAMADGTLVGCLAASDGLYRYENDAFRRVGKLPRGQVVDLELVEGADGWAIATDRLAAGSPTSPTGVLLRLRNCEASEVRLPLPQRLPNVLGTVRDVDWWLLSAATRHEIWLAGVATGPWLYAPLLVGLSSGPEPAATHPFVVPFCAVRSMVALPANPGTDIWLASDVPCGPNPSGASGRYAGPVGQLSIRPVEGRTYLPSVRRNAADDATAPSP